MTDSCLPSSSTGLLALLGYEPRIWFLTLPATSPRFFIFEMMNDYSMYPYIPTGAVSISGPPLWLFNPLTTDNHIPKDSPVDIKHPSSPVLPDIDPFSSDFALEKRILAIGPSSFPGFPRMTKFFSDVVYFLTGGRCKVPDPSSPYALSACGLYLEFAALSVADNSCSLPDADPVVPDPLPGSLPDADPSLVPIVPPAPVSSNALALATYATPPRPLSYVAIALHAVSLPSPSPSRGLTSPVATQLRPRRPSPPLPPPRGRSAASWCPPPTSGSHSYCYLGDPQGSKGEGTTSKISTLFVLQGGVRVI